MPRRFAKVCPNCRTPLPLDKLFLAATKRPRALFKIEGTLTCSGCGRRIEADVPYFAFFFLSILLAWFAWGALFYTLFSPLAPEGTLADTWLLQLVIFTGFVACLIGCWAVTWKFVAARWPIEMRAM